MLRCVAEEPCVVVALGPRLLGDAFGRLLLAVASPLDVVVVPGDAAPPEGARVLVTDGGPAPAGVRADVVVRFAGDVDDLVRRVVEAARGH
jgi:hypothetical protein